MRFIIILLIALTTNQTIACTGGTNNQGSLTATLGYQTVATMDGYYYSMNVVCGNTYNFDFCGNGGSTAGLWPEISILNAAGTIEYAFSPYSGGCSTLNWVASFTGTIQNIKSIDLTKDGKYTAKVVGTLTMHGVTKPVQTSATLNISKGKITGAATIGIILSDFNIDASAVTEKVDLEINCNYSQL